jgi:hypothetical protein
MGEELSMEHAYAALLIGCAEREVTLRPMEREGRSFDEDRRDAVALLRAGPAQLD